MAWLYKGWPITGGILSTIILVYVFLISPYKILSIQSAVWLNFAFLMLHQFEEYVYPGGFKDFFNNFLYKKIRVLKIKLNDKSAFHVNVTLGWAAYLVCAITASNSVIFLMIIVAISFINGIVHTAAALVFRKYNPGLITAAFIFIPFALYIASQISREGLISTGDWLTIAVCAAAGSLTIPLTLFLLREKEMLPTP